MLVVKTQAAPVLAHPLNWAWEGPRIGQRLAQRLFWPLDSTAAAPGAVKGARSYPLALLFLSRALLFALNVTQKPMGVRDHGWGGVPGVILCCLCTLLATVPPHIPPTAWLRHAAAAQHSASSRHCSVSCWICRSVPRRFDFSVQCARCLCCDPWLSPSCLHPLQRGGHRSAEQNPILFLLTASLLHPFGQLTASLLPPRVGQAPLGLMPGQCWECHPLQC